jgi:hypothetical protein
MDSISDTKTTPSYPVPSPETAEMYCQEPQGVIHLDEELGMCYALELPCGVSEELGAERFREENGLSNNPAVRLQGTAPSANKPRPNSGGSLSNEELMVGIVLYLGGGLF